MRNRLMVATQVIQYIFSKIAILLKNRKKTKSAANATKEIKKSGGKLVTNIEIFDVYEGINIGINNKSIAFKVTFEDYTKTLTDEEVMVVFNKIISDVENKFKAKLRNM